MNEDRLDKIDLLITKKKINEAQFELSKLGAEFHQNSNFSLKNVIHLSDLIDIEFEDVNLEFIIANKALGSKRRMS